MPVVLEKAVQDNDKDNKDKDHVWGKDKKRIDAILIVLSGLISKVEETEKELKVPGLVLQLPKQMGSVDYRNNPVIKKNYSFEFGYQGSAYSPEISNSIQILTIAGYLRLPKEDKKRESGERIVDVRAVKKSEAEVSESSLFSPDDICVLREIGHRIYREVVYPAQAIKKAG